MKAKVTKEGLMIPKEVTDRALGEDSEEVEILEEPGRLLIVAKQALPGGDEGYTEDRSGAQVKPDEDPILGLGSKPVHSGVRDGSTHHDRYLYGPDE